jgi:hypothetical protein
MEFVLPVEKLKLRAQKLEVVTAIKRLTRRTKRLIYMFYQTPLIVSSNRLFKLL